MCCVRATQLFLWVPTLQWVAGVIRDPEETFWQQTSPANINQEMQVNDADTRTHTHLYLHVYPLNNSGANSFRHRSRDHIVPASIVTLFVHVASNDRGILPQSVQLLLLLLIMIEIIAIILMIVVKNNKYSRNIKSNHCMQHVIDTQCATFRIVGQSLTKPEART